VLILSQHSLPASSFVDLAQVDIQVEALLWRSIEVFVSDHPTFPKPYNEIGHYETRHMLNETSGWSGTQTIVIPESSHSLSPSPTPSESPATTLSALPTTTPYPTETATAEHSPAPKNADSLTPLAIVIGLVIVVAMVSLSIYIAKHSHKPLFG
jgi:hypothetical protein